MLGTADAFAAGKRHHVAGESKAGKTLSIGLILAIDVVLAGGVVVTSTGRTERMSTRVASRQYSMAVELMSTPAS